MEGLGSLLLFALSFYLMMRFGCGAHMIHGHGSHHGSDAPKGAQKDPVCGMDVAEGSGYMKMYDGRLVHFCSRRCLDQFEQNPAKYSFPSGVAQ